MLKGNAFIFLRFERLWRYNKYERSELFGCGGIIVFLNGRKLHILFKGKQQAIFKMLYKVLITQIYILSFETLFLLYFKIKDVVEKNLQLIFKEEIQIILNF